MKQATMEEASKARTLVTQAKARLDLIPEVDHGRGPKQKFEYINAVRVTPEMMAKLRAMADEQGRSLAGMVRVLMRYGIEWMEREAKGKKEAGR